MNFKHDLSPSKPPLRSTLSLILGYHQMEYIQNESIWDAELPEAHIANVHRGMTCRF